MSAPVDLCVAAAKYSCQSSPVWATVEHSLSGMPVEVLWVVEETKNETVRLLFLHRQDVRVLACPRADEVLEEPAEFAESGVVGPVCVTQPAIPSDSEGIGHQG